MSKQTIAVLFGGVSSEHEVSLLSAASVLSHIPTEKYEILPVGITKDGAWLRYSGPYEALPGGAWERDPGNRPAFLSPDRKTRGLVEFTADGKASVVPVDAVFPVLHGANGEDGTVQGLCTLAGLPFVGCGPAASAVCMDKALTKTVLGAAGVAQAKWLAFDIREYRENPTAFLAQAERTLGFPVFVKPANAGSSVGISRAENRAALKKAVEAAAGHDRKVVLEEAVRGKEIECAVLGNYEVTVSVPGEIVPSNAFYDYEAKYLSGSSELHIPARISQEKAEEIRRTAARAYRLLGCEGMVRMDFFLRGDGAVLLNEPNTIPGFTAISMYPKLFDASGLPYSVLLDRLIELALAR